MQQLKAALICIIVLYGIDALWFNGRYFAATKEAIAQTWQLDW